MLGILVNDYAFVCLLRCDCPLAWMRCELYVLCCISLSSSEVLVDKAHKVRIAISSVVMAGSSGSNVRYQLCPNSTSPCILYFTKFIILCRLFLPIFFTM